ncbi:MAG TPA: hypothetical protein VN176_11505 [Verrucomicrobiae bacterium]|nr:hypothetical protein [Verrucomicrobiae bacterium]
MAPKRKLAFTISYVTITYRSVFLALIVVLGVAAIVMYFVFPDTANRWAQAGEVAVGKLLVKMGADSTSHASGLEPGPQQAHFTNIDGTVRVKKVSTNTWITADYSVALEKGDVVQTSSEGIAKIVLTDGTNYTVKPDSLIVVQENSVNSAQQTSVAVTVTTGMVDLATANMTQGSKSQVTVAGATASLASESTAQVVNDVHNDAHEILLKKGSGEVIRNGETVKLSNFEKVSFTSESPALVKSKEIGPPVLIDPPNMQPVFVGNPAKPVDFSWAPVEGVQRYRLKISKNAFFSSLIFNQLVDSPQIQVSGLPEGNYYWEVQSIGENAKESIESDKNRFTVIPRGEDKLNITLELEAPIQHGHLIEIRGRTEPNARVMVNGQDVAAVGTDGSFHHFTSPLPTGLNVLTITAQNRKGGVNTKTQQVVIQ